MDINFNGKVAVVTGAGKGIGRAIAVALAAGGATVHAISRTKEDLDSLKQKLSCIHTHTLDISDWDKTRELVQSLGPIHLLVNNAGVSDTAPILESTQEQLRRYTPNKVVAADMISRGEGGQIVNISSEIGVIPWKMKSVYCISKAALNMMTKCLALELGEHKIRVNAVLPGLVKTHLSEATIETVPGFLDNYLSVMSIKKLIEIKDVVNAALFLLSDKSDMITGCLLPVDGGTLSGKN